ncbi:MAG: hypothetical protein WAV95_07175 [Azonexus sp.]
MKWLSETISEIQGELKSLLALFKRGETWLTIGMIAGFALLAYAVGQFAMRTDSVLRGLGLTSRTCRELTNGPIIFLFCGMIFFLLATVVTFGEIQTFFDKRQRGAHFEARLALRRGLIWSGVAILITVAALLFFRAYCR